MNKLADAFLAAGLCSKLDVELTSLTRGQLKARRTKLLQSIVAGERSAQDEQDELLALNKAIRAFSAK
jgi:hypothetical protein